MFLLIIMPKYDFFSDTTANLFDNPMRFLMSFIMLAVPSGIMIHILLTGPSLKIQELLGDLLLLIYNAIDKITLFIFETFINLVVYAVVMVIFMTYIL